MRTVSDTLPYITHEVIVGRVPVARGPLSVGAMEADLRDRRTETNAD